MLKLILSVVLLFIIFRNLMVLRNKPTDVIEGLTDISNNIDLNCIIEDTCTPCDDINGTKNCTRRWISKDGTSGCVINGKKMVETKYNDISCNNIELIEINNPVSDVKDVSNANFYYPLTPEQLITLASKGRSEMNEVINSQEIYNTMNKFANDMTTKISDDLHEYISVVRNSHKTFVVPLAFQAPALMLRQDKPDMIAYNNRNPNGGGNTLENPLLTSKNYTEKNISNFPLSFEYQMRLKGPAPYESTWNFEKD